YRYGNDDASGPTCSHRPRCGAHRRPRGKSVVYQDDDLVCEIRWRSIIPVGALPALELFLFLTRNAFDGRLRDAVPVDDVLVEDAYATRGNCAHRQFSMTRWSELSHQQHFHRTHHGAGHVAGH